MADAPKLVDLAYSKAEKKEEAAEYCSPSGGESDYPWGLCLTLEKRDLDKLGIKAMPEIGGEVHFIAVAKVTSVNQSARMGQDEESRVGLQIIMMQVLMVESAKDEKGEKESPASEAKETAGKRASTIMGS